MRHSKNQIPTRLCFIRDFSWLTFLLLGGWCQQSDAQWSTQTNTLKAGWNAVYLHVDASHTNISGGLINAIDPIDEVWMWTFDLPPGFAVATPPDPTPTSQWSKWVKLEPTNALKTIPGNAALLVKASAAFTWRVKGRPVPPSYRWTLTGLNFVGFPAAVAPTTMFETFLAPDAQALDWKQSAEIFRYQGGNLGPTNPIAISPILQRSVPVLRDQAYWIRTGEPTNQVFNHYFGPFQVSGVGPSSLRFGDSQGQARLYLKNMTKSNLTVTLREVASESSPAGLVPTMLPLMVRGALVTTNLTFTYSNPKDVASSWSLAPNGQPGSEAEIILGVDRSQMVASPGVSFAGVLRFTDSFGLTRVDIGASATSAARSGLWVGNAMVDQVSQYLRPYAKANSVAQFHSQLNAWGLTVGSSQFSYAIGPDGHRYEWDTNTGRILVFGGPEGGKGKYLQHDPTQLGLDKVARPVPLRLIIHNDGTLNRLMQRAYLGRRNSDSNQVVAARQAVISGDLANARRLSAVHLPTSDGNGPWTSNAPLQPNSDVQFTIDTSFRDQASNPFLHAYHPDHDNIDNRDDTFRTEAPPGQESYDLHREMTLSITGPGADFDSRTRGGSSLEGDYAETVSILANDAVLREFNVLGKFTLTRVADTPTFNP